MQKILVSGRRGAGKSYYVKNLAKSADCEGILTKKTKSGVIFGYMINFKIIKYKFCGRVIENLMRQKSETFDNFGVEILNKLMLSNKLIIIDEIGFLELSSNNYCARLLELLNLNKNIIAVIRDEKNWLIDKIKKIPNYKYEYIK